MREKLIELYNKLEEEGLAVIAGKAYMADLMIANGVTIQRWLSVKDNPPNEGEMILVCAGGQVGEAFLGYDGFRWANGFAIEKEVTHWMPLPEAPKGE